MARNGNRRKTQNGERPPLRDVNAAVKTRTALRAVIEGSTFEQAAEIAGYASRGACWTAIQKELDRCITPEVDYWRKIEIQRLSDLYELARSVVVKTPEPELADELGLSDGDELSARRQRKRNQRPRTQREINLWAIDRCIAIEEQLRRLLGLDAKAGADLTLGGQVLIRRYDADVEAV